MAMNFNPEAHLVFFKTLFGESSETYQKVKHLFANGVKFEVKMYDIFATYPADSAFGTYQQMVAVGTSSLMKGAFSQAASQQKQHIVIWVKALPLIIKQEALNTPVPPPTTYHLMMTGYSKDIISAIKAVRQISNCGLKEAKDIVDNASDTSPQLVNSFTDKTAASGALDVFLHEGGIGHILNSIGPHPIEGGSVKIFGTTASVSSVKEPAKPTSTVMALRDAQAIGQKVRGTSAGSLYYCVAVNPRVKVATRIQANGTISIRAEWENPTPDEMDKLQGAGLSMKSDYASMHLDANGVAAGRVVGAFLLGLGIKFDSIVSGAELVCE